MKKQFLFLAVTLLLFFSLSLRAQTNISGMFAPSGNMENSFLQPCLNGSEYKIFKFSILPVYANVNANFTTVGDLIDYANTFKNVKDSGSSLNYAPIHRMMNGLKNSNIVYGGADITLFNLGIHIRHKKKAFLDLQFSARQHVQAQFNFNKELAYLIYKGNKYYENQEIDILPKGSLLQYGDYGINIAKTFSIPSSGRNTPMKIRPALRLRYLVGNAHFSTEKSSLNIYTAPEGRYIDASLDGIIQQSYYSTNDWTRSSAYTQLLSQGAGHGFAWDAGILLQPNDRLTLSFAAVDNGNIRFTKNAMSISASEKVRWEGYNLNHPIDTLFNIDKLLKPDTVLQSYRVPIGTKFSIYTTYGLGKAQRLNRYATFYAHNLTLYFQQGFINYLNTSANPLLAIGYSYRYKNQLNVGGNMSLGGNTGFGLGAHFNFSMGPLQIGLSSNSLIGLINRYDVNSLDLHLFTSFSF